MFGGYLTGQSHLLRPVSEVPRPDTAGAQGGTTYLGDTYSKNSMALDEMDYRGVVEKTYTFDNPEIQFWASFFQKRMLSLRCFETFEESTGQAGFEKARVVGTQWYRFSAFMPWFLCQAAASVSDNERRHYVIQTAFEELGMRDVEEIHPEMFREVTFLTGVTEEDYKELGDESGVTSCLQQLRQSLLTCQNDAEIMGILLGLEIPAEENIDTIFNALVHKPNIHNLVADTKFFRMHRAIEVEHIRLTISNFIRFCESDSDKLWFIHGFDKGILFWSSYWNCVAKLIQS